MPGEMTTGAIQNPATPVRQRVGSNWSRWIAGWLVLLAALWSPGQTPKLPKTDQTGRVNQENELVRANQGNRNAQLRLGKSYYHGTFGRRNRKEAARWFQAAADQGSDEAMAWLGICYLHGHGVARDEKRGKDLISQAAAQGNAVGLRFMGLVAEQELDYVRAADLYRQAANHGDSHALIRLARLNARGLGQRVDKKSAASLLAQAAQAGNQWAQLRLGLMHERGSRKAGIEKNPLKAVALYEASAAQDNRIAAYHAGQIYSQGLGAGPTAVPQDAKKALTYFKQAALQGYAPAQYELGRMREEGAGVEVNLTAAYYWYTLARRRGHELAGERLFGLRQKMGSEEIKRGDAMLDRRQQALRLKPSLQ